LGLRAELLADVGAYTRNLGGLCPSITAASLPGPYRIRDYAFRVRAALTCKGPGAAYRGAGHPEAGFRVVRTVWTVAEPLGLDPCGDQPQELHPSRRVPVAARALVRPGAGGLRQRRLRSRPRRGAESGALPGAPRRAGGRARPRRPRPSPRNRRGGLRAAHRP